MRYLKKLKKATRYHRCDWAYGCRKMVKYWYPEKDWYYCKKHGPKFEQRNQEKYGPKTKNKIKPKKAKSYKTARKLVTQRVLDLRKRATWAEKIFNDKMRKACPVKYQFQRGFIKGGYFAITDFYIPSRKICIEIDGDYHKDPEQQKKDKRRDNWLRNVRGMKVCRLTNKQAINMTIYEVESLIKNMVA